MLCQEYVKSAEKLIKKEIWSIEKSVNLRVKRFLINGVKVKFRLCASCLKKIVKEERELLAAAANKQQEDIKPHLAEAK